MNKKRIRDMGLFALAVFSVLTMGINSALAYFTTYTVAEGGYTVHLGDRTQIRESFDSWTKHLTVTSDPEAEPVFVRARAFCARYGFHYAAASDRWTTGKGGWNEIVPAGPDEYYYYTEMLRGGESTDVLDVVIEIPSKEEGETLEDGENFNVIVIYESTPVRYREDGTPYADWTQTLDVVTDTGSGTVTPETETGGETSEAAGSGEAAGGETSEAAGSGEAASSETSEAAGSGEAAGGETSEAAGSGEAAGGETSGAAGSGEASGGEGTAGESGGEQQ